MNKLNVGIISEVNLCFAEIYNILVSLFKFLEIQDHFPIHFPNSFQASSFEFVLCYVWRDIKNNVRDS